MYALVQDNEITQFITSPINVRMPDGCIITDIRLLSAETRHNLGIYDYYKASQVAPYQIITGTEYQIDNDNHAVKQVYTTADRDVDELKAEAIKALKNTAKTMLLNTDHDVLESLELGTTLDTDISTYRAAVRQTLSDATTAINALTTAKDVYEYQAQFPDPLDANA